MAKTKKKATKKVVKKPGYASVKKASKFLSKASRRATKKTTAKKTTKKVAAKKSKSPTTKKVTPSSTGSKMVKLHVHAHAAIVERLFAIEEKLDQLLAPKVDVEVTNGAVDTDQPHIGEETYPTDDHDFG